MDEIANLLLKQNGYAAAYQEYLSTFCGDPTEVLKETKEMVQQSVTDQVRNFPFLCHFLSSPGELMSQTAFHIPPQKRQQLIEVYFDFDEVIVRELIGTKFKAINRKGLESLGEKTKKKQHTIKRVYENLRIVYQYASKIQDESISGSIQQNFSISRELAEQYVLIVFLCFHRFESSKKRLLNVRFKDFITMAALMANNWCNAKSDSKIGDLDSFQFDKDLVDSLKMLKPCFTKEVLEEYKQLIVAEFASISSEKAGKVEKELTVFLKNMIALSVTLQGKEIKDFFVTLAEKIRTSLKERMELNIKEVRGLLRVTIASFDPLGIPPEIKQKVSDHWTRFLSTVGECVRVIYPTM